MSPKRSIDELKANYRLQCAWLLAWANELDANKLRIVRPLDGREVDISREVALDCRCRAADLQGTLASYEDLEATGQSHSEAR